MESQRLHKIEPGTMIYFKLFSVVLLAQQAYSTEYARGAVTGKHGYLVPMDISLDNDTMVTYPGHPSQASGCFKRTINFHDFQKGLVAMKAVGSDKCFVKPTSETYRQVKRQLRRYEKYSKPLRQSTEGWELPEQPLDNDQIVATVGTKIANFCSGCKVYVLQDGKRLKSLKELPRLTKQTRGCNGWWNTCWSCRVIAV